ncbi:hypothetical protein BDB01DRAFT_775280 [Pilobolus umbonatus]|nr:hypothetical protein BDB01DRAFT_775280 [Pilobolus umbonatus]
MTLPEAHFVAILLITVSGSVNWIQIGRNNQCQEVMWYVHLNCWFFGCCHCRISECICQSWENIHNTYRYVCYYSPAVL